MNIALEHALDTTNRLRVGMKVEVQVQTRTSEQKIKGTITKIHAQSGNLTIQESETQKTYRGISQTQVIDHENRHGTDKHMHALLTDLAACYDSIPFVTIQLCIARLGLPPNFTRLIRGLQTGQYRSLKIGKRKPSDLFLLKGGLSQGCGLSGLLLACITAAIIDHTNQKGNRNTTKCICHNPLLTQNKHTSQKHKTKDTSTKSVEKERIYKKCECNPYTIIGPCTHHAPDKDTADHLHKNIGSTENKNTQKCTACLGLTPKTHKCTHQICNKACTHRKIELYQQWWVDDCDLLANMKHGLKARTLACGTMIYAMGMRWNPKKCHYITNDPVASDLEVIFPDDISRTPNKTFKIKFPPVNAITFKHKLLGVQLSLNPLATANRSNAALGNAASTVGYTTSRTNRTNLHPTHLRQVLRWCATTALEYRTQQTSGIETFTVLHEIDNKIARTVAKSIGLESKSPHIQSIVALTKVTYNHGGLNFFTAECAARCSRIAIMASIIPTRPTVKRKRKNNGKQTDMEQNGDTVMKQADTPPPQISINTIFTPTHTHDARPNEHDVMLEINTLEAKAIIAQIARVVYGKWTGPTKDKHTNTPQNLHKTKMAVHGLLQLAKGTPPENTTIETQNTHTSKKKKKTTHSIKPPMRLIPNPLWRSTPTKSALWPYSISKEQIYEHIIPKDTNPQHIQIVINSDGSLIKADQGKESKPRDRLAYAAVGHIYINKIPVAHIQLGGRIASPRSVEEPSSARIETAGICESIRIAPINVKTTIYLDAFSPIQAAASVTTETNTKRTHRTNRHFWNTI